jgi:hypothetical protein
MRGLRLQRQRYYGFYNNISLLSYMSTAYLSRHAEDHAFYKKNTAISAELIIMWNSVVPYYNCNGFSQYFLSKKNGTPGNHLIGTGGFLRISVAGISQKLFYFLIVQNISIICKIVPDLCS